MANLRRGKNMTQVELDKAAGLPVGTVAHLEAGTKLFSDARLTKLASVLGVTIEQILLGSSVAVCGEMELLMAELGDVSRSGLLELTLQVRNEQVYRKTINKSVSCTIF